MGPVLRPGTTRQRRATADILDAMLRTTAPLLHALRRAGLGAAGRHPWGGGESRPVGQRVFYVSSTASYAARRVESESLVLGALSSSPVHRHSCVGFGDQHRGIVVLLSV